MAAPRVMRDRRLERLRHARVVCNENIAKLEARLAYQCGRWDEIEAEIQAIAPRLRLPTPNRNPNPMFKRGDTPRLSLAVLREAAEPLAVSVIAWRVSRAKGIERPTARASPAMGGRNLT
jgi:hypothetical protein